jgi:hypothetical protein
MIRTNKNQAVDSKIRFRAGGVAPVVERLPSKHEAQSSNSSTEKKNRLKNKNNKNSK